jgi:hypothetical protein
MPKTPGVVMVNRDNKPLAFLLTFFFLTAFFIAAHDYRYTSLWTIGDWLINYSAGFVRRGLPGAGFLLISRLLHVSVASVALVFPALIYGSFLVEVFRLASPLRRNYLWFAMLFSPATIPFIVLNVFDIAFRKETLLLGALALFIYMLQRNTRDFALGCSLTAMFATLVLSHEGTIICFPYFVAAIALVTGSPKRALKVSALPLIVACGLFLVVSRHPGTNAQAREICQSVNGSWNEMPPGKIYPGMNGESGVCAGSIAWIGKPVSLYKQQRAEANLFPAYVLRIPLAFLPFCITLALMYRKDRLRYEVRWVAGTALLCFLGSVGIFVVALDWGRWIYMQAACLMLVTLLAAQRSQSFRWAKEESAITSRRILLGLATFLYCVTWTVPTNSLAPRRYGYLPFAHLMRRAIPFHGLRHFLSHNAYEAHKQ